ncbi:MAG: radical SAM protein, partial [Myxococcales bacterium]
MELSRFVLTYRGVRPGEHVLYSVLDDRYVGIDDATLEAIGRWSRGSLPANAEENDAYDALSEDGFLVEDRSADDERLREHLDRASEGVPGEMHVTLMPTLACNLACDYCFQKEHPAFGKMQLKTEEATVEWILRAIDERKLRALNVHYFGGEPLTRRDFVLRTAEILWTSMAARGGTFAWSCTTNGVNLTPDFARRMGRFGEGVFKVTLDGDRETHDRMR